MFNHVFNHHAFTGELCYKRLSHFYYTKLNKLYIRRQPFHLLPQNSEKCIQTKQKLNVYIVYSCHTVFILFQCCVDSPVIRVMCKLCDIIANVIDFKSNH